MNYKTRKFAGFTLIELLVVIVIIGILATISIATFNGYFEKARLAKAQQFASTAEAKLKADTIANGLTVLADCPLNGSDSSGNYSSCLNNYSLGRWGQPIGDNFSSDTPFDSGKSFKNNYIFKNGFSAKLGKGITISVWIKHNKTGSSEEHGNVAFYHISPGDGFDVALDLHNTHDDNSLLVPGFIVDYHNSFYTLEGPLLEVGEKWHHLLGIYNNETKIAKFYLNGELVSIQSTPNVNNFPSGSFVGGSFVRSRDPNILINSFQVYPIAMEGVMPRSSSKIRTLADGGDEFDLS